MITSLFFFVMIISSTLSSIPSSISSSSSSKEEIIVDAYDDIETYPYNSSMIIPINTSYSAGNIIGYRPSIINYDGYPLFVYITGTTMSYKSESAISYTQYMANNGFIAVSAEYNNKIYPLSCNGNKGFLSKAKKLWDKNIDNSLLNILCNNINLEFNINCTKGIVISGFSQGAQLALLAPRYNGDQINGIYIMGGGDALFVGNIPLIDLSECLSFNTLNTESFKIRSMVGENDGYFGLNINGVRIQQNSISGTICKGNYITDCLQNDGSGWYIIQEFETASGKAPHCYAYKIQCAMVMG